MEIIILIVVLFVFAIGVAAVVGSREQDEFRQGIEEEQQLRAEISALRSQILTVRENIQKVRLEQQ
jgi:flagellar basal body-associated protein FliL